MGVLTAGVLVAAGVDDDGVPGLEDDGVVVLDDPPEAPAATVTWSFMPLPQWPATPQMK